jgi:hypothetical protein
LTFESGAMISTFGTSAFSDCSSLQSICIPSGIQTIPDWCFSSCTSLSNLRFESGCTISVLGDCAFSNCLSLRSISIPSSITSISATCFKSCPHLVSIVLEAGHHLSVTTMRDLQSRYTVTLL